MAVARRQALGDRQGEGAAMATRLRDAEFVRASGGGVT